MRKITLSQHLVVINHQFIHFFNRFNKYNFLLDAKNCSFCETNLKTFTAGCDWVVSLCVINRLLYKKLEDFYVRYLKNSHRGKNN